MRSCERSFNYENFQLAEISVLIASPASMCSLGGVGMCCVVLPGPGEKGKKQTGAGEVKRIRPAHTEWEADRPG